MKIAELDQKIRLSRRKFVLYEDKVAVEIKTPKDTSRYEVDIRDTGEKLHYHAENTKGGYIILAVIFLVPVVVTIVSFTSNSINGGQVLGAWFCSLVIAFLAYIKEHVDDVYLTGGKTNLYFFRNIPSEQEVLHFIELVMTAKREMLKKEYLAFDKYTDEEEYHERLVWLRDNNLITKEDFENAKIDFEISRLLQ
ncbi:hypothetical protein [Aridibaculum aurantiacum]|uniref:hypothetical protein n=1 Tax=Aridibaculum aurantiacum TaxID=2810307 RepID=UPI001A9746DF|nr:hypothetical protein [Aridibaculum aurantiacum]